MSIKVSELPAATLPLTCDESIMVVQSSTSKKITVRDLPFSPTYSIGLIANRYYSAPSLSMTATAVVANVLYVSFVIIPHRATITKLGFNVTVAAPGNARMGLYSLKDGALTTLAGQTGLISTSTTGAKEGAFSAQVDAGTYAVVGVFSAAPAISWHGIGSHSIIGSLSPIGFQESASIPFTFGSLPATYNTVPTFVGALTEPHLWFRL
jgi:hypothetical protein